VEEKIAESFGKIATVHRSAVTVQPKNLYRRFYNLARRRLGRNAASSRNDEAASSRPARYRPDQRELQTVKNKLERLLTENIMPFWYPEVIDSVDGGYRLNHDLYGKWRGPANKDLITQARTLWFFSRLFMTRYGAAGHVAAARHGYEFIRDRMWDREYGGFYWEVDASGKIATRPDKHVCGQAFALYALYEYVAATGDASGKKLLLELFNVLEARSHDTEYGGYREYFRRDWSFTSTDLTRYVRTPPNVKLMSTHLHLMEAVTWVCHESRDTVARERLLELILIQLTSLTNKIHGKCTDQYGSDWKPQAGSANHRVSFGHLLKTLWMLAEACAIAGVPNGPLLDLYRQGFRQALKDGFDHRQGGFYEEGPFGGRADHRDKVWYVQAEGMLCALQMHRLLGGDEYWKSFTQTLEWIMEAQADWRHGDWHWQVAPDGTPSGDKAAPWKGPYHNGRAVIRCLELLATD